jgi:hypothetical protein
VEFRVARLPQHSYFGASPRGAGTHIAEPTHADAIGDRLMHNAYRVMLKGPSRRNPKEDQSDH